MTTSAEVTTFDEFETLAGALREAAALYYAGTGDQLMDDATYDAGIRSLRAATALHPDWSVDVEDLLTQVAAGTLVGDIAHTVPMLSLDNAMDQSETDDFFTRAVKLAGVPAEQLRWRVEPKLDGMALVIRYVDGRLTQILTRGDGRHGEDVTANARHAQGVPETLPEAVTIEARGEVVMTHADFEASNRVRGENGARPFANPRNAVAGTLRSKQRTYELPTTFLAYGLVAPDADRMALSAQMAYLYSLGFQTAGSIVPVPDFVVGVEAANEVVSLIEERRPHLLVDTDGVVVKLDDPGLRADLGEGTRSPRWAIARKFDPDTRETDLLGIVVGVGRTGNLSFTAEVEPVFVGGVTVSSATLHSPSQIALKGLRVPLPGGKPQRVVVRRAGEVIPEIVGAANDATEGTAPFEPPAACPRCGSQIDKANLVWRCSQGRECAIEANVQYAVSRDALDLEGLGAVVVHALVSSGRVQDAADLFTLTMDDLLAVDHLGEKNATKILDNIERARQHPLSRVFTALGVVMTGRSMSRRLARHFGSLAAIRAATVEQLQGVEGVGPDRALAIYEELVGLSPVLDRLEAMGIGLTESFEKASSTPLAGKTVVVTGTVPGLDRQGAKDAVERLGGRAASSVSSKTTLLVIGTGAGKDKLAKAEQFGVEQMTAEEFAELVASAE